MVLTVAKTGETDRQGDALTELHTHDTGAAVLRSRNGIETDDWVQVRARWAIFNCSVQSQPVFPPNSSVLIDWEAEADFGSVAVQKVSTAEDPET